MKKITKFSEGKHSFLFWMILPLIMIWLSFSYVIGLIKDKPLWNENENTAVTADTTAPYIADYEPLSVPLDQPFITLWFDDAWLSQYTVAYPELKSLGFQGTIAVPVNAIETPNYMNWAQLRALQKDGWEISNHSLAHNCNMQGWEKNQISEEYKTSKLILWKNKLSSDIFVTPCGVDSSLMREEAQKNFLGYRTVDPGFNDLSNLDFYNLKVKNMDKNVSLDDTRGWIDEAKETNSWLILVFHLIGQETKGASDEQYNTNLNDFRDILEYIKSSGLRVVVPSQILSSTIK